MEQTQKTRPGAGPPRRGGWLVAATAFAVVIVVALIAFVGGGGDSVTQTTAAAVDSTPEAPATSEVDSPTTTSTEAQPSTTASPPTTEETDVLAEAEDVMRAFLSHDVAGIEAAASPRANTSNIVYNAGFTKVTSELHNGDILDWRCSETAAANLIWCEIEFVDDLVRAAGLETLTVRWELGFAFDGLQTASSAVVGPDPFGAAVMAMFETHPEWFGAGGPCDGGWDDGDPSTCAPAWNGFILEWFAENG